MKKNRIYLSPPHMGGTEQEYIKATFGNNWIAPLGPDVDAFEEKLSAFCGVQTAAALSSGTAALHLALILLGIKKDDLVLCQSFTFAATAFPIKYQGAIPVFIDSEQESWNMDPELLEKAIIDCMEGRCKTQDNKTLPPAKPKAIMPVHLYGMPYDVSRIHAISEKYDIPVIEDSAEALGSKYGTKMAGSFGKLAILSFNGNKIITTSGGGALLSNSETLIERARFLATQARDQAPHYEHSHIGFNYRMSNIVAGIGLGQMEVLQNRVDRKREIHQWYRHIFNGFEGISFLDEPNKNYYSNRWLTTILINNKTAGFSQLDLRNALEKNNIESRPLWKPMHMQPVFYNAPAYLNGVSENLFNTGICLPSGTNMNDADLARIKEAISLVARK